MLGIGSPLDGANNREPHLDPSHLSPIANQTQQLKGRRPAAAGCQIAEFHGPWTRGEDFFFFFFD